MTRTAEIEGVGTLEFPDDTPDSVIESTVSRMMKEGGAQAGQSSAPPAPATPPPDSAATQPPPPPQDTRAKIEDTESPFSMPTTMQDLKNRLTMENFKKSVKEGASDAYDVNVALRDAAVRPIAKAASSLMLLPFDAVTGVRNFIDQGDFSAGAFARGFNPFSPGGANDRPLPSQEFNAFLDRHTQAPQTTAGKVAEMISTGLLGSRVPGMPARSVAPPVNPSRADMALEMAEQKDIPFHFDDYTSNPFAKKLGVAAENVPLVGTAGGRATQAKRAQEEAQALTNRFGNQLTQDVPNSVQTGLQNGLRVFRNTADHLYRRVARELDPAGPVPRTTFDAAIAREAAHQASLGTLANPRVVALLEKYQQAPQGNFSLMRDVRTQLREEIKDFYRGGENAAIGERGVERLREMRTALENDMGAFAQHVGGPAADAWRTASRFYRTNLVPFKERGFAELVRTAEPERAWSYLKSQGGIESRAARMYNSLDESGRGAVRAGMMQDAMREGTTAKGNFSPAKFAKFLEDHESVVHQFFRGSDRAEVTGFQNLMRHVERAGQYMENPPTGNRLIGAGMLGVAPFAPKAIGAAAGIAGTTKMLFQTKPGRDLLIAASRLKAGSPAMDALVNSISRYSVGATAAARSAPEEQEQPSDEALDALSE